MPEPDLIIRGRRVVLPDSISAASIHISGGEIVSVDSYESILGSASLVEVPDECMVLPGLVDTHVHINSPGREHWEGFNTATQAAAAGGVTTLVDMPLNSIPPTTTRQGLQEKLAVAQKNSHVDLGFWGGLVPSNIDELSDLWKAGVVGFKCFLVPSGVDEFPNVGEAELREALPLLARWKAPLIVHAELPGPINKAMAATTYNPTEYETFLKSRPRAAENDAVEMMIRLSREFDTQIHIVHLSSSDVLPALKEAQLSGVRITAETCPHYLHFASERISEGATQFKCCPPIREETNREALWNGLADGTIGIVVSDHSPCPIELKERKSGDFMKAWGGISSLQLRLPVIWTEGCRRGFSPLDIVQWLARGPAAQVGFENQKGSIEKGRDADIVIIDPNEEFRVEADQLRHRHPFTPYDDEVLRGVVKKTFLRGKKIYDGGEILPESLGRMLLRN